MDKLGSDDAASTNCFVAVRQSQTLRNSTSYYIYLFDGCFSREGRVFGNLGYCALFVRFPSLREGSQICWFPLQSRGNLKEGFKVFPIFEG